MIFTEQHQPPTYNWEINGERLELGKQFCYLEILFRYNLSWEQLTEDAQQLATQTTKAVTFFFSLKGVNSYLCHS